MNDVLLLLQMLQNGDLGGGTSSGSVITYSEDFWRLFGALDNQRGSIDSKLISLTNSDLIDKLDSLLPPNNFPITADYLTRLVNTKIILHPQVDRGEQFKVAPIILNNFYCDYDGFLHCQFEYMGENYWKYVYRGEEGYLANGYIKGTITFVNYQPPASVEDSPKREQTREVSAPSNINAMVLDTTYGMFSLTYDTWALY